MALGSIFAAARHLRAVCVLGSAFTVAATIYAADTSSLGPSSASNSSQSATTSPNLAKPASKPYAKPLWSELTSTQQQALAPLAAEWDKLEPIRKKKMA